MPRIAALHDDRQLESDKLSQCLTATLLIAIDRIYDHQKPSRFSRTTRRSTRQISLINPATLPLGLGTSHGLALHRHHGGSRVAFLAKSVLLRSDDVLIRPPAAIVAVGRGRQSDSRHSESKQTTTIGRIFLNQTATMSWFALSTDMASLPEVFLAIQIDFDATKSERSFYRELITDLRQRLPANVHLSITALASWCMDDDWLSDLAD